MRSASMMQRYGCSAPARATSRGNIATSVSRPPRDKLPSGFFAELAADFEESTIPYDVDLVDLRRADAALVDEVRRTGVLWRP